MVVCRRGTVYGAVPNMWMIGVFTLFLHRTWFSWYLLWLLPLQAIFVQPGKSLACAADACERLVAVLWVDWLIVPIFINGYPTPWAIGRQYVLYRL